jgi:type II secretory pathway pseudopilin PulG
MLNHGLPRRTYGFSLIELAIGLTVVAALLAGLLVPLSKQLEQRRTTETQRLLLEAREALLAFAMGNRRLPCPASATSNGVESFVAPNDPSTGVCETFKGFLPGVTLGLSPVDARGYVPDGWGDPAATTATEANAQNRIRYAVMNPTVSVNSATFFFTRAPPQGMVMAGIQGIAGEAALNRFLSICGGGATGLTGCNNGSVSLANGNAIAVIWSVGANGYLSGTSTEPDSPSPDEVVNLDMLDTQRTWNTRPYSTGGTSGRFDDQIVWISAPLLLSRMVAAGALP